MGKIFYNYLDSLDLTEGLHHEETVRVLNMYGHDLPKLVKAAHIWDKVWERVLGCYRASSKFVT